MKDRVIYQDSRRAEERVIYQDSGRRLHSPEILQHQNVKKMVMPGIDKIDIAHLH